MMLLPNVPDFRSPERSLTKIHQIITARCAFAKKEQNQRSKGGTIAPDATRWHVNAPCGLFQHQDFLPCRRITFLRVNRKDIVAFPSNDDVTKSQLMQLLSEFLRDIGRVHGQGKLSDINPFTKKCRFELYQHEDEQIGFRRMIPTLFGAKQQMQRQCDVLDGEHNTE